MNEEIKPKKIISDITRQKMREAKLKNPTKFWLNKKRGETPQEIKDKISNSLKGHKQTPEHKKNAIMARIKNKQIKSLQNNDVQPPILSTEETNTATTQPENNPEVLTGHDELCSTDSGN